MNIFHVTRCLPAPQAYGGYHRSRQIVEILSRHGIACTPVDLFAPGWGNRTANLRAGLALARHRDFPAPRSYSRLWVAGKYHHLLAAALVGHPGTRPLLVWENTEDDLFAYAASRLGIKVVAVPHDLVALNRPGPSDPWPALAREAGGLVASDGLFTISLEERWFLRLLGCPADWLPYHPPANAELSLARVRAQRRPAANAPILLLGSVSNPQTRAGLIHQLRLLRDAGPALGRDVIVAGNGTGELAALAGPGVDLRGSISDDELAALLAQAAVLWTYQIAGTGALTRIVEALVAGLPVAGGGVALRSTAHLTDVYPAETVSELRALLSSLPAVAANPPPPFQAEREFVAHVTGLT